MTPMHYFTWDMDRVIVHLFGPLSLRWYSLCFVAGILVGNFMYLSMVKREGKSLEFTETLLYYIIIGTVVGARLGHCLFYEPLAYLSEPWRIFMVWEGGLASHGGYAGVVLAMYLFSRFHPQYSFLWIADRLGIAAVLGGGFIRIGNFFNSEIVGRVTDVRWAVIFKQVDEFPRHPSQLYESAGYFSISLFMFYLNKHTRLGQYPGRLFGLTMIISFVFRAFIEMFKENQVLFENNMYLNMGQLLSVPFILCGLFLVFGGHEKLFKKKQASKAVHGKRLPKT